MKIKAYDYLLVSHLFPFQEDPSWVALRYQFPGLKLGKLSSQGWIRCSGLGEAAESGLSQGRSTTRDLREAGRDHDQ